MKIFADVLRAAAPHRLECTASAATSTAAIGAGHVEVFRIVHT
jgi:hypothetical protein